MAFCECVYVQREKKKLLYLYTLMLDISKMYIHQQRQESHHVKRRLERHTFVSDDSFLKDIPKSDLFYVSQAYLRYCIGLLGVTTTSISFRFDFCLAGRGMFYFFSSNMSL